jgi:hypothetical protein
MKVFIDNFKDTHCFFTQNILTLSLETDNNIELKSNLELMKRTLWVLSNYVANGPTIIEEIINDQTFSRVVELASKVGNGYNDIFCEAMFVITNTITLCDATQFGKLLDRDIILLLIRTM